MTTKEIYNLAIELGTKNDLRGVAGVVKYLARIEKNYEALPEKAKAEFDSEKLVNPYSDTRVLVDNGEPVKKILVGIDMEGAELLLAKQLGVDLVIAHHPEGAALADLSDVMHLQAQVLADYGLPINVAESIIKPRLTSLIRGLIIDSATLIGKP